MYLINVPKEIIIKIIHYIDNDIDIRNFLITNKSFYKLYYYLFKLKFKERLKYSKLEPLFNEYYNLIEIDKKKYINVKSYMYSNSLNLFKNQNYYFICKIYLDEIIGCNYLPKIGYLKFYISIICIDDIYHAKIIYKKQSIKKTNISKQITNILTKNRKYLVINKKYSLPLSYMRNLYIEKNLAILAMNDDPVIENNEKFSDKYLFGFQTYYEDDPLKIINETLHNEEEWILFATFDPKYIFTKNKISKEMISFVIKKKDLKKIYTCNIDKIKIDAFAIYNDKINEDEI